MQSSGTDIYKVEFQHTLRLVRIVSAFVCKFCHILATECEVLLSRLINLLDSSDNPFWMQTIALEVSIIIVVT